MLGSDFAEMLRCIRCGACLNHCPVYQSVGGHAYGSVYPGPMGAVLTPGLFGIDAFADLPNASTLCGACESVCPVRIPLPKLLRQWRERAFDALSRPAEPAARPRLLGLFCQAPAALSARGADRDARPGALWPERQVSQPAARQRLDGAAAISRRRKARPFRRNFAARKKP